MVERSNYNNRRLWRYFSKVNRSRIIAGLLMIVGIGFLGMVTGSIATYFVSRLSKTEPTTAKSIADEQIEYIKGKLDSIADLNQEEIRFLNQTIMQIWEMKVKGKVLK